MAAEAEGLQIRPLDGNHKTCLTRIGPLMEGLSQLGGLIPTSGDQPQNAMTILLTLIWCNGFCYKLVKLRGRFDGQPSNLLLT